MPKIIESIEKVINQLDKPTYGENGDEWIEKMTNFFDYQENSEKLVTNQYVKKLMK